MTPQAAALTPLAIGDMSDARTRLCEERDRRAAAAEAQRIATTRRRAQEHQARRRDGRGGESAQSDVLQRGQGGSEEVSE